MSRKTSVKVFQLTGCMPLPATHSAPAWNPYLTKDINLLESVQKGALKVSLKQWNTPDTHQLLNWSCLSDQSREISCFSSNTEFQPFPRWETGYFPAMALVLVIIT